MRRGKSSSFRPSQPDSRLQRTSVPLFSMGLIADIQLPDLETRMAIYRRRQSTNMRLPRAVIEYIALTTPRILENWGALIRAVAYISISGLSMTVENIAPVLNPPTEKVEASPDDSYGCSGCILSDEDSKVHHGDGKLAARQIAMYLMRQHTPLITGEEFGGKDHTTVYTDKITQLQKALTLAQTLRCLSDRINLASCSQNSHNQNQFIWTSSTTGIILKKSINIY